MYLQSNNERRICRVKKEIQYKLFNKRLACSYIKNLNCGKHSSQFETWLLIECSVQKMKQFTLASTADLDKRTLGETVAMNASLVANSAAITDDTRSSTSTLKHGRSMPTSPPKMEGCCSSHTLTDQVRRHSVVSEQLYEVSMYK